MPGMRSQSLMPISVPSGRTSSTWTSVVSLSGPMLTVFTVPSSEPGSLVFRYRIFTGLDPGLAALDCLHELIALGGVCLPGGVTECLAQALEFFPLGPDLPLEVIDHSLIAILGAAHGVPPSSRIIRW